MQIDKIIFKRLLFFVVVVKSWFGTMDKGFSLIPNFNLKMMITSNIVIQ